MSCYDKPYFSKYGKRYYVIMAVWIEKHGTKNSEASITPLFEALKQKDNFSRNFWYSIIYSDMSLFQLKSEFLWQIVSGLNIL